MLFLTIRNIGALILLRFAGSVRAPLLDRYALSALFLVEKEEVDSQFETQVLLSISVLNNMYGYIFVNPGAGKLKYTWPITFCKLVI